MADNKRPFTMNLGSVKATIWENIDSKGYTRHNVELSRLYRDGDEWRESKSFGRDDLLLLQKLLGQAHDWILAGGQTREEQLQSKFLEQVQRMSCPSCGEEPFLG